MPIERSWIKTIKAIRKALSGEQLVCSKPCNQCLFSKNKIVRDERAKEILKGCEDKGTHFICHKGTIAGKKVVCNGFYREKTTPYLELMKAAAKIKLVDPESLQRETEALRQDLPVAKAKRRGKKM